MRQDLQTMNSEKDIRDLIFAGIREKTYIAQISAQTEGILSGVEWLKKACKNLGIHLKKCKKNGATVEAGRDRCHPGRKRQADGSGRRGADRLDIKSLRHRNCRPEGQEGGGKRPESSLRGLEKDAPADQGSRPAGRCRWRDPVPHGRSTLPVPGQELCQDSGRASGKHCDL